MRELAAKYHAQVIDLHGPMTAFNLQQQKSDPTYTLIGPDRVHPGLPGNLMMAWLFLNAQGAPALVSNIVFDAGEGRIVEAANATVMMFGREGEGWTFTVLEKALPYPVDAEARELLDAIPLEEKLNHEIVQIKGLAGGSHLLLIDGERVACHTAAEWSNGVNPLNEAAPQVKQAAKVAEINETRRRAEVRLRATPVSAGSCAIAVSIPMICRPSGRMQKRRWPRPATMRARCQPISRNGSSAIKSSLR